jgi:hypothetical protein
MAIPQQQATPPAGGLNQARPAQPPQPAQAPKQENLAARAAGMVQEENAAPEDFFTKTMRDLQTQRAALNSQTEKLLASLDARQNRMFDPMLMKTAMGFLKPTKTGSFGESLGYAAEAATEEAEKEFARNQQMEKLKYELSQKQLEQAQQQAIQGHMMRRTAPDFSASGQRPVAGGPAAQIEAPTGAAAERTPGAPQAAQAGTQPVMRSGAPRQQPMITDKDVMEAMILDPSGKLAQQYRELMKSQQEDVINIGDTPYSRSRQEFLDKNPNAIVEIDFGPLFDGAKKVPYWKYQEWAEINKTGNRAAELEWFYKQNWLKRPPGSEPGAAGKPGAEPETAAERKRREAIQEERAKQQIKEEAPRITRLENNFDTSREFINTARGMNELATSNKRAFDLMNDDGVAQAVMRAAKQGISAGNLGSISIPTDTLYQGVKLPKEDREALQMFAREYANLTVQFRKAARVPGEGATTEREGDLYAALGALPTDTARVIRMKAEFLELKGRYDQEVFKVWDKYSQNPDATFRGFLGSDDLNRVKDAYDRRLGELQKANSAILGTVRKPAEAPKPGAAPARPAATPAAAPAAAGVPPKKGTPAYNNLPEGGLFEDTDGTIRRKPKGG